MNDLDVAKVIAMFHGAYPRLDVDEAVAIVWKNTLATADFHWAEKAADEWIATERFFPTPAEFNGMMTRLRQEAANQGQPETKVPALPAHSGIRCNGEGWLNRGAGMEPCPTCNPWTRKLWEDGEMDSRRRPPHDWVQPPACRPNHSGEGSQIISREVAMKAVLRGLVEHYTELGLTPEQIDKRIEKRMPRVVEITKAVPEGDIDHLHPV